MEELLALMAAEDEDNGQEEVPALAKKAALTAFPQEEGEAAGAGADGRLTAETGREAQEAGRDAVERLAEGGQAAEESFEGGLAWTAGGLGWEAEAGVQRQAVTQALGQALETLDAVRMETVEAAAGRGAGDGGALTAFAAAGQEAGTGLERLYRQTVRASAPAAPALPAGAAGRAVRAEEPGSAAPLAVEELDRAVRRDSRRYDGGMSIF